MKTTTFRIIKRGPHAEVFMPDGSKVLGVKSADVHVGGPSEIGTLTLVLYDFIVDSCISPRADDKKDEVA